MKNLINKLINGRKLILNTWICLWICLIILVIMKYCFGIWYPIVIKNESLLAFNNYIDSSWLKYLILSCLYLINTNLVYLTCVKRKFYTSIAEGIIMNVLFISTYVIKIYTEFAVIGEIISMVIIPIIVLLKEDKVSSKWISIVYPIIIQVLVMLWQLQMLFIRSLPIAFDDIGTLFITVAQLDYYIFLLILWIGVSTMGLAGIWFFCKDVTKLKAYKEQELAKEYPDMEIVKKIDAKIAKLEESK